uniref:tetratricopeptide repeat-containing sensor histidine kinase n=1 Tax=Flavobacterium sp. TaxID=239 RepID=UPI00404A163A
MNQNRILPKFIFILVFCYSVLSLAQASPELLKKIQNHSNKDSVKVELLIDYCVANTFSNTEKNLEFANEAFTISKNIKYKTGQIRALNCLGNYYYQQAIYDKATNYYTNALKISESSNDISNIIIGKSNLASIYNRTNQQEKALVLFKEADSILIKAGLQNSQNRAAILTNIGGVYSSLKKHKEAIEYHKKTLSMCETMKIPFGIAIATLNIGEEFVNLKDYSKAAIYLEKSKKISEEHAYSNFLGPIYKNLGIIYWNKNQKKEAIASLEKAIIVSEKINGQNELLKATSILHGYYAENKDYKNAYLTSLKTLKVNNNVNGIEKQKAITEINTKYETQKKEIQIASLQKDKKIANLHNEKQQNLMLILVFLFFSILSTIYVLFNRYKIKQQNKLLREKLLEAEKTIEAEKKAYKSELKAFKSQMNPHFFYNALNTIQSYILSNDKKLAISYLSKFSVLTRSILEMTEKDYISIAEEIKTLELYLEIEKARFNDDFEFEINTKNITDLERLKIPTLFLQPYVENAVKHGLLHKTNEKKLNISFLLENKTLKINILDNGIGREKSAELNAIKNKKHKSFATEAMQNRIDILNRTRTNPITLNYIDLKNNLNQAIGTEVIIEIPM